MTAYKAQGELLRAWRHDVAGFTQGEVATRLRTSVARISQWETAGRGLTFEELQALDQCYSAGGALWDLAQALGTRVALPPRELWTTWSTPRRPQGWAWLRDTRAGGRLDATVDWGPVRLDVSASCDARGVYLQLPPPTSHTTLRLRLAHAGWVDFGRGTAPGHLGAPVIALPASARRLAAAGHARLVAPWLAQRAADDAGFASALKDFLGDPSDLVGAALRAGAANVNTRSPITVHRPYPSTSVPRFSGQQYQTLRNGRCITLEDAAAIATALFSNVQISAATIWRLEHDAKPRARFLRSRLDVIYGAGGHTVNERVEVGGTRPRFVVTIPPFWRGPTWFEFDGPRQAIAEVTIRHGSTAQAVSAVPGGSVIDLQPQHITSPYLVECPLGWTLRAGVGARPGAPTLDLDEQHDPQIHEHLLHLFGRTPQQLDDFLRGMATTGGE